MNKIQCFFLLYKNKYFISNVKASESIENKAKSGLYKNEKYQNNQVEKISP